MRNLSLIVVALVDVVVVPKADLAIKNCQKFTFRRDLKGLQAYIIELYRC